MAFAVFGSFWGSWGVAATDIEHALHLSHGGFGALLSVALAGASAANVVGGSLTERHGTSRVMAVAFTGWSVLILVAAVAPGRAGLALGVVLIVASGGLVDIGINVAATAALAATPGGLVRMHARFNGGAAIGALAMGALLLASLSFRWMWVGVAAAGLALAPLCARTALPAGERGEQLRMTAALRLIRHERLLPVAGAFALAAMVEGGIELWAVVFVRTHLPDGLAASALSAAAAYTVAALARLLFGPWASRRGATRGVAVGAATASVGLLVLALAPNAWIAGAGVVAAAGGISMCWPLLLAVAAAGRERPGVVVGGVSSVGYLGFVLGPTLIGAIGGVFGLEAGLFVLAGAALVVVAVVVLVVPAAARA